MNAQSPVTIIGRDAVGVIAEQVEADLGLTFRFYLTPCCAAAVTGVSVTVANPRGVACKGCYRPVDPALEREPVIDPQAVFCETCGDLLAYCPKFEPRREG